MQMPLIPEPYVSFHSLWVKKKENVIDLDKPKDDVHHFQGHHQIWFYEPLSQPYIICELKRNLLMNSTPLKMPLLLCFDPQILPPNASEIKISVFLGF